MIEPEDAFAAGSRFKEGTRRALREILVCCVLTGVPFGYFESASQGVSFTSFLIPAILVGAITGPFLWLIYRVLRFAIGR
jgi:hypothetical protein